MRVVSAATTIGLGVAVFLDWPRWLRGPAPYPPEWQWELVRTPLTRHVLLAVLWGCALLALLAWSDRMRSSPPPARRCFFILSAATLLSIAFQLALLGLSPGGALQTIVSRTINLTRNTFFMTAASTAAGPIWEFLARYDTLLPTLPMHAGTHPPGPTLFYRALIGIFHRFPALTNMVWQGLSWCGLAKDGLPLVAGRSGAEQDAYIAAAVCGTLLLIVCASLTCWAVAALADALTGDRRQSVRIGVLWTLCPAAALFVTELDASIAFLVACSTAAMARAMGNPPARWTPTTWAAIGGALGGATMFFSWGTAPMLAVGAASAVAIGHSQHAAQKRWRLSGIALVAFLALFFLPALSGYNPIAAGLRTVENHGQVTLLRSYTLWLRFNLLDFALFLGPPIVVLGLSRLPGASRALRSGLLPSDPADRFVLVATVGLLLLNASGMIRGETGRLWLPLMPLALVASVASSRVSQPLLLTGALQLGYCLVLRMNWGT